MNRFVQSLKAVFLKDILIELRSRQVLPTMIVQGMLIVWILRMADEALPSTSAMGPVALWVALIFSGLLAQERSFAAEHDQGCMDGLLMAPVDEGTIYLAKLLANIVILSVYELILAPAVVIAFRLKINDSIGPLILVLLLGNIGISSVGTLFSAVVQLTRTRGAMLSILVLAVLAPMMIPAVLALLIVFNAVPSELVGTGALAFVGTFKSAAAYMAVFDAVFVTTCWLLFGFVIKE